MSDFKMPDLGGLMQAAQNMQREMQRVQDELAQKRIEAASGGGMVTAVMNGQMQLLSLKIEPQVIDPKDPAMLQDLVIAAINQAITKAKDLASREMASVTGGLQMPGLPSMF
jgi:DNA-binding YbaB/EbfC family protein